MAALPTHHSMLERLGHYAEFDQARQSEINFFVTKCIELNDLRATLESDLEDERTTKRAHKKRADQLEAAVARKFVVVLIDGDGYYFRKAFFEALANGGSRAANELYNQILENVKESHDLKADCDVLVNVYANKHGLARTLVGAKYLGHAQQMDQFFCSFTQGRSLFQFIDCGPGKERVDAKLRDTFRFYLYNAQCQRVYLACTHDSGYAAEFDKYSHDPVADKIMLVHGWQTPATARQYNRLPFKSTNFLDVFECTPLEIEPQIDVAQVTPAIENLSLMTSLENDPADLSRTVSKSSSESRSIPLNPKAQLYAKTTPPPPPTSSEVSQPGYVKGSHTVKTGIPVNRLAQRVDLKITQPGTADNRRFEERIRTQRLCNEHHLRDNCMSTPCKYDHAPIDDAMYDALRIKARSIPCSEGAKCRRLDCYYGHQCPWSCSNPNCAFNKLGLHLNDTQMVKLMDPTPYYYEY